MHIDELCNHNSLLCIVHVCVCVCALAVSHLTCVYMHIRPCAATCPLVGTFALYEEILLHKHILCCTDLMKEMVSQGRRKQSPDGQAQLLVKLLIIRAQSAWQKFGPWHF